MKSWNTNFFPLVSSSFFSSSILYCRCLPVPPPPPQLDASEEMIIAFQTPPLPPIAYVSLIVAEANNELDLLFSRFCRSPLLDRFQLPVDDTIVKPHRLVNRTLGNITQMSFVSAFEKSSLLTSIRSSISIRTIAHRPKRTKRSERRNLCNFSLLLLHHHHCHLQHHLSLAPQRSSIRMHSLRKWALKRRGRRRKSTSPVNLPSWLAATRKRKALIGKNVRPTTSKTKRTPRYHKPKVKATRDDLLASKYFSFRLEVTDR